MSAQERLLPHDLEAERAILGAILLEPKAIHAASDCLLPEDFYLESHRIVFRAMLALTVESIPIDIWMLKSELTRADALETAGGLAYVSDLTSGVPRVANLRHYAAIVRERATSRKLIALGNDLMSSAWSPDQSVKSILESAQSQILKIYGREIKSTVKPMADIVNDGYQELCSRRNHETSVGILTGFSDIDRMTGGFRPGNLVLLAGRPGSGKSALATNIAENSGNGGKRIVIFSVEMGQTEIYNRMVSGRTGISCHSITQGYVSNADMNLVARASGELSREKIWIDDSGSVSIMQMRARAQRIAAEHGIDLIIVDYLQLVKGEGKSAYERVSDVSRNLKVLAKDLKVPVLALSQLHRLQNETDEPGLSDLRESGALEQDADLVIMLWADGGEGYRKCKIAKQRNGEIGSFDLGWIKEQTKFTNIAKAMDEPGLYQDMAEGR